MANVSTIKNPKLLASLVFLGILMLSQLLVYQQYRIEDNKLTENMHNELIDVKDRLKTFLSSSFTATLRLAYIVENYGVPEDFNKIGKHFLRHNKNIDALQLARGGAITHVYPLKGHENVIGYNILLEKSTRTEALRAITQKDIYFAGPFKLKQGGSGIVGRYPIYKNEKFWGFAIALVYLKTLTQKIGIDSPTNPNYTYQLAKKNPNTGAVEYFLNNGFPLNHPHTLSFYIPEGQWTIYIHTKEKGHWLNLIILSLVGLIFSAASAYVTWHYTTQPIVLEKLVQEKTAQIIETEKLLSSSLDRTNESFISLDAAWRYTYLNRAAMETHPGKREDLIGKSIWDIHPQLIGTSFEKTYKAALKNQESGEIESFYEPMQKFFSGKIYPSKEGLTIIYSDITERKRVSEALEESHQNIRKLNNHLNTVREEERTNIAREIHDELGQQLTALKMDAYWLNQKINGKDEALSKKLADMLQILDQTIQTVRKIASDLRPGILDDLGLSAALEWQSAEIEKRSGIPIKLSSDVGEINLDKNTTIGIFRIYQEALTNILRHAQTPSVIANFERINNQLILRVQDFGVGFNVSEVKHKNTFGLSNMSERALMLPGFLKIESTIGKGTIIELTVNPK